MTEHHHERTTDDMITGRLATAASNPPREAREEDSLTRGAPFFEASRLSLERRRSHIEGLDD